MNSTYSLDHAHKQAGKNAAACLKAGDKRRATKHLRLAAIFLKLARKWN